MRLTASEAARRRCQEGFGPGPMSPDGNSHIAMSGGAGAYGYACPTSPTNCIAGQCMAWRWTDQRTDDGEFTGYCGKAGPLSSQHLGTENG